MPRSGRQSDPPIFAALLSVLLFRYHAQSKEHRCIRRNGRLANRLKQLGAWDHMAGDENWIDIGSPEELSGPPLRRIKVANRELAISLKDGKFGAVSNICNHAGGPLGE
ncbi:MAG: Rieske 2Fe-2S domain-containing protein, partial [Methylocella sp.]